MKEKKSRRDVGREGEQAAEAYLVQKGFRILARNVRCKTGEIDIVAEHGDTVVFVEVRSRKTFGVFGEPEESVDARKRLRVRRTAEWFLYRHRMLERKVRFDVITVRWDEGETPQVNHIFGAF